MDAMDWRDYFLARQHIAEERVGSVARRALAAEDQTFARSREFIASSDRRHQR